ncbi:rCG40228, partial [Rattus norvegicus]
MLEGELSFPLLVPYCRLVSLETIYIKAAKNG